MTENRFTIKGRVMALDLGEKRIGVAISDPTRTIAQAYSVVQRTSRKADYAEYGRIIEKEQITLLVVGLPVTLGGNESEKTKWVRHYTAELEQHISIPTAFWDEALTTVQATASLRKMGKKGKKARQKVDAVAATLILQNYLDAHYGGDY
ncbi:MAG: Holliday junction resolvase RuvX [Chloroflexi bacterium]|nr:Holliday junction resolvase RuvX [Chloroflexota bacterium]